MAGHRVSNWLIWVIVSAAIFVPVVASAFSPLLAWREPVYIIAGFAGVVAMGLLLLQPMLAGGYLPSLKTPAARRFHRWLGGGLVAAVIVHVGGLWITSPPDVVDALLFASPTPFSVWGVTAMWAVFATALLALFRRRLSLPFQRWRLAHLTLALITVAGSVVHALLIEGTMELFSKIALCALVAAVTGKLAFDLKIWEWRRRRPQSSTRR